MEASQKDATCGARPNLRPTSDLYPHHAPPDHSKSIARFLRVLPRTACAKPRAAKCGDYDQRRLAGARHGCCDFPEVTGVVDSESVCGGHRDCGAMAGGAEIVGGGGSAGNSRGRNSGDGIFSSRHWVTVAWACALFAWLAIGGLAAGVERATIPANHIAQLIADGGTRRGRAEFRSCRK
jgi:hypothetical protein